MNMISTTNEEEIKVVRTASCPSLSGSSTISYEIGSQGDSQYIRLVKSSNGGLCSHSWISMQDIQNQVAGLPNITSKSLRSLYGENSPANNTGFLAACIINEKLAVKKGTFPETPPEKKPAKAKKAEEAS